MDRFEAATGSWVNPSNGQIIAATGKQPAGLWDVTVIVSANTACHVAFRKYTMGSVDSVINQFLWIPAQGVVKFRLPIWLSLNDSLQLSMASALTGTVCGALLGIRRF